MTKEKSTLLNIIMYGGTKLPKRVSRLIKFNPEIDYKKLAEVLNNFHSYDFEEGSYNLSGISDYEDRLISQEHLSEREPYQAPKAHLISQTSNRRSSSIKTVDDYRIQNDVENPIQRGSLDRVNKDRYYKYNIINNNKNSNNKENVPAAELRKIIIEERKVIDEFKKNLCINWKNQLKLTVKEVFWLSLINCYNQEKEIIKRQKVYNYPCEKLGGLIITKLTREELEYLWSIIK